jgi:uncharacterized membrane protein
VKVEAWVFGGLTAFFVLVTPIYWYMSNDPTGTSALVLTTCLAGLVMFYLLLTARRMAPR